MPDTLGETPRDDHGEEPAMPLIDKLSEKSKNRVWIDQGGKTACTAHGGHYLLSAVVERPRAKEHFTPLAHWMACDHLAFEGELADAPCEACEH